jgi:hypothetical protein
MSASPNLADLRQLLAVRFPSAAPRLDSVVPSGVAALDEALGGGLPTAAFTELVNPTAGGGGNLVLASLLATTRQARQRVALLDASDGFAPDEFSPAVLDHLVWARGGGPDLKPIWAAADLLLRDPHFAVVVIDLRGRSERELLRTPGTTWYRLQRALEQSTAAGLVFSPGATVPSASHRFCLDAPLTASALVADRTDLFAQLCPRHDRQRVNHSHSA